MTDYEKLLEECGEGGLNATLGIRFIVAEPGHTEAVMPITPAITQPFGYVHGGVTLSLLESVASAGSRIVVNYLANMCIHREQGRPIASAAYPASLPHKENNSWTA